MAELYRAFGELWAQGIFYTGKERCGARPVPQPRRDQANTSFEIRLVGGEQGQVHPGVKKHLGRIESRLSFGGTHEQAERWRDSESYRIVQELVAIQAAGEVQEAAVVGQIASPGQETLSAPQARREGIELDRSQTVEKNLATARRQRKALREAAGWVYWPELFRHLKQGGGGEEKRLSLTPPENTFVEFMKIFLELFLEILAVFLINDEKKSGHTDEIQPAASSRARRRRHQDR